MTKIKKYNLQLTEIQHLEIPKNGSIRKLSWKIEDGHETGIVDIWIEVNEVNENETRTFYMVHTNNTLDDNLAKKYIDTLIESFNNKAFGYHFYEIYNNQNIKQ